MKPSSIKIAINILFISLLNFCYAPMVSSEQVPPNTYFYPEGANDYFIKLLIDNNIPYEIDYDNDNKIKKITWNIKDNKRALEQAVIVNERIGATKTAESIKMLSPEMNDRFEKLLKANNIPYNRKGDSTYYEWGNWVEVQILKRTFWKKELENIR